MYRLELILSLPTEQEEQEKGLQEIEEIILEKEGFFVVLPGRAVSLDYGIRSSRQCLVYLIDIHNNYSDLEVLLKSCISKYQKFKIESLLLLEDEPPAFIITPGNY